MTRAIGIDIGSRSIKIAELEVQRNERLIVGLTEIPYSDAQHIATHLKDFFAEGGSSGERIGVGIGAIPVVVKHLSYPFGDKKRCSAAIRADFEDSMPFEITNQILDFKEVSRKGRSYEFIAGLCPEEPLNQLNSVFDSAGVIPNAYLVDCEALGQLALDQCLPAGRNPVPYVVCDFGYLSTKITVVQGTRPQTFNSKAKVDPFGAQILEMRVINRGSRDLISWIQDQRKLSADEAEQWLIHRAEIKTGEDGGAITDDMSDDIKEALRPVVVEIYQTLQAFRSKAGRNLATIYVTGGMTKLRGIREFLAQELRAPVNPWPTLLGFRTDSIPISPEQERSFAAAISLAHRYSTSKPVGWLNFKRSSQASKKILTNLIAQLKEPALRPALVSLGIALICVYGYMLVGTVLLSKQRSFLQGELATELRRLNHDLGKRADRIAEEPDRARQVYEQERSKVSQARGKSSMARARSDVLLDISQSLPVNATLRDLEITDNSSSLEILSQLSLSSAGVATDAWKNNIKKMLETRGYSEVAFNAGRGAGALVLKASWKGGVQ